MTVLGLVILLLFSLSFLTCAATSLKFNFEPSGSMDSVYSTKDQYSVSVHDSRSVAQSLTLGGEMTRRTTEGLVYGAGMEYQLYRKADGVNNTFSFLPIYALVRTEFRLAKKTQAFIFGRAGYNFYQEDNPTDGYNLNGGLYYAAGAGLKLSKTVEMQLMYSCHNGEAHSQFVDVQHAYSKYSMGLGIRI